ncbi:hypothetical protein [Cellulophaga sp. L1A9]|uniref:TapB family protein n=1 Tax=Cellulophaga sp. L1A9 TaxID=2686362 RepID=UPI0018EF2E9B|nr:hypothetical protein [Cellulophaga sp. L1A9]
MKNLISALLIILLFSSNVSSQINCSRYYPLEEGTTFQYTSTNKKGKIESTADYKISKVDNTTGTTVAEMTINLSDHKGKEIMSSSYHISCSDTGIKIDFQSLMPGDMLKQYQEMDLDVALTGTDIELPNDLTIGQELTDANVTMNISMAGMNMKTIVNMMNRKVEKKENVTTSSGSYECFVIYSENESQVMGIKKTFPSRLWLAEGVGMVKQESYKSNGDLISATALTKFNN